MAKKNAASASPAPAKPPARRRRTKADPAAAPVDVATVAGTEFVQAADERNVTGDTGRPPSDSEIAEAAYHRYLSRGGQHGSDFDDWLEAERELRSKRAR